jgi:uncharacterized protein YlxW (UPF0749 family)
MMIRFARTFCYNMEGIKALEERVGKLEFVLGAGAEDVVRKVQLEILQDLYAIRAALKEDLKGENPTVPSENKELLDEIKKLREENSKLNYRINHLKRYID